MQGRDRRAVTGIYSDGNVTETQPCDTVGGQNRSQQLFTLLGVKVICCVNDLRRLLKTALHNEHYLPFENRNRHTSRSHGDDKWEYCAARRGSKYFHLIPRVYTLYSSECISGLFSIMDGNGRTFGLRTIMGQIVSHYFTRASAVPGFVNLTRRQG